MHRMRVAVGSDEGCALVNAVVARLAATGHDVALVGEGAEWPEVGRLVGEAVAGGAADTGVVCCFTGTGVSIAANKVAGVRAALCGDAETARGARRWNDANVLALSIRVTGVALGEEIVDAFMSASADEGERPAIARVERDVDG